MLKALRNQIAQDEMNDVMESSLSDVTTNKIRSAFLDQIGFELLGAENDPEIKALIDQIPEYDEYDESVEMQVQTESLIASIPETEV